jgi:hypothetical protein
MNGAIHKVVCFCMPLLRLIIACALLCIVSGAIPHPQDNYKMHCLYLYKFSQLIKWPEGKNPQEFTILVVGVSPLIPELEQYINSKNKSSAVKYKLLRFASAQAIEDCNLLYITKEQLSSFELVVKKIAGKPILFISEVPGLIKKGSCINLITEEGSGIKVQINKAAIESHNLKISPELLKLCNEIL